jgi:hypothetical protein
MRHPELDHRVRIVPVALELEHQPHRYRRPAQPDEALQLHDVGDGHDARDDGDVDPHSVGPLDEVEVEGVVEEELGDDEVQPGVHLGLEVAQVVFPERSLHVPLGVSRPANAQVVVPLADEAHQLRGVPEPPGERVELVFAGRGVAPEREQVLDPHRQELLHQVAQLLAGVAYAGEVGHRLQAGGTDLLDELHRPVPGASSRPVGDGDEARLERPEVLDRADERAPALLGPGGEELEGEAWVRGVEPVPDLHRAPSSVTLVGAQPGRPSKPPAPGGRLRNPPHRGGRSRSGAAAPRGQAQAGAPGRAQP